MAAVAPIDIFMNIAPLVGVGRQGGGRKNPLVWYQSTPLYVRIVFALAAGLIAGGWLGPRAVRLKPLSDIVLQLLALLATPLILFALLQAILRATTGGRMAARMMYLLTSNTVVAIFIGLMVINVIRPGRWAPLAPGRQIEAKPFSLLDEVLSSIPHDFVEPFRSNKILAVILLAVTVGIALRRVRASRLAAGERGVQAVEELLKIGFDLVMVMLQWVFHLVPLAVFAVAARTVGTQGYRPLISMGGFVLSVLLALLLQAGFYLFRLRLSSSIRPGTFVRGASDALALAFSTASSAATLPVTYACVRDNLGVREECAGLGVMIGGTFNHDGTALYEAMAALFISQALGIHLGLGHQLVVVIMSILASVGAAGIPEAGLVTMLAVFTAVRLPTEYIPLLLPLDWFLDRCRTAVNVMGDMTVTCILDGKPDSLKNRKS